MNNKLRRHGAAMREHAKVVAFTGRERRNEYSEEVNYRDAAASVKICKIIKPIKNKGRRKKCGKGRSRAKPQLFGKK